MPGCHSTERGGRNAVLAAHAGAALPGGGLDANACLDSVGADDPAARLSGAKSIERHRWLRTVTVIAYHSPAICTVRSRVRRAEVVAPYDNYRHRRPFVHIFGHRPLIRFASLSTSPPQGEGIGGFCSRLPFIRRGRWTIPVWRDTQVPPYGKGASFLRRAGPMCPALPGGDDGERHRSRQRVFIFVGAHACPPPPGTTAGSCRLPFDWRKR